MILMSANIRNMANGYLVVAAIFTIVNTYVWIYVVTTAIHATRLEKFFYAIGSAFGVVLGIMFSRYLIQPHAITRLSMFITG